MDESTSMSGPNVTREDLTAHFHLPISEAARRLNICTTVMKKICRQHGISRWPQRKVAALNKRIKALEYEQGVTPSAEKKASISEQLKLLNEELAAIFNCTAPCLTMEDQHNNNNDGEGAPHVPPKKRKLGFDGPYLRLDKMEVETDESMNDMNISPQQSPMTTITPRNPFPQNSPRYRLQNNRLGLPSPHRDDSSEFVEESPRSDAGGVLPSLPHDDAMSMLLEAITSIESEQHPTKKMRVTPLPSLSSLRSVMTMDITRPAFNMEPYASFPLYDFTPRPAMAPQSAPMNFGFIPPMPNPSSQPLPPTMLPYTYPTPSSSFVPQQQFRF